MKATLDRPDTTDAPPTDSAVPPDAPRQPARFRTAPGPWRRRDAVLCGLLAVLGVAGLVVCWVGASDEVAWRDQIGWTIGAVFATGVVVLGGALWILVGLREVRRAFRELRREQRTVLGLTRAPAATAAAAAAATAATATATAATATTAAAAVPGAVAGAQPTVGYVTAPEMTRAHRPDCLLMRGKSAVPVPAQDVERYSRCGVCCT